MKIAISILIFTQDIMNDMIDDYSDCINKWFIPWAMTYL